MEFLQESHPHESYLELAAMAGIPLLVIFLVLLGAVMRDAIRSCRSADKLRRPLLAGAVAAVAGLALNSLAINAWTLPPLAAIGWFIAGLLSSPMLTHFDIPHSRRLYRSAASSRHETTARASR
jgi:O-antigen ligase